MAEGRLDREQERLATKMCVPPADENLCIKSLQSRDIPYEAGLNNLTVWIAKQSRLALLTVQIAKQSNPILDLVNLTSKIARQLGQKFHLDMVVWEITMNKSWLLSPPPQIDEAEHFISAQTFRLKCPPTPFEG